MKKATTAVLCILVFAVFSSFSPAKKITGEKVLSNMYKRHAGKWYKNFTFTQTTENYRNDSLIKTATWYEAIVFPYDFRISFGDIKDGNAMIQKKDSVYIFRKGDLIRRTAKGEDLTFLLGGMYFMPFDSVKTRMVKEGYDITKAHESVWQGNKAFVIGTDRDDEKANQLWIDKKKMVVVRFIKYAGGVKEEAIFSDHIKLGKAWSETSVSFYRNDKLLQKEKYYDCKVNTGVNMQLFDPYNFYYK